MTTYIVKYKLATKWGLDRGELGGYQIDKSFNTLEEAQAFINEYPAAQEYKSLDYCGRSKYVDHDLFFLYVKPIQKSVELFDKKNLTPRMRMKLVASGSPLLFELHGKFKKSTSKVSNGYFCSTSKNLIDVWKVMKSKNVAVGKIYAIYDI